MPNELAKRPVLDFAHDGKLFHAKIRKRVKAIPTSMNALCKAADVAFSTSHRWKDGSTPEIPTVHRIERTLKLLEESKLDESASDHGPSLQHAGA